MHVVRSRGRLPRRHARCTLHDQATHRGGPRCAPSNVTAWSIRIWPVTASPLPSSSRRSAPWRGRTSSRPSSRSSRTRTRRLPIGQGQTISQPYIVALTVQALAPAGRRARARGGDRVGLRGRDPRARRRRRSTPSSASRRWPTRREERLARLGYRRTCTSCAATARSAGRSTRRTTRSRSPRAARASRRRSCAQLAVGGRLVIPVGPDESSQVLVRVTRRARRSTARSRSPTCASSRSSARRGGATTPDASVRPRLRDDVRPDLATLVREAAEPIDDIETASIDALLDRIGDARVVLLGEATHGTSEFYRMRARITRELIAQRGFQFVAVEADWPDAARIDDYVLGGPRRSKLEFTPFARFPTWMWRNDEVSSTSSTGCAPTTPTSASRRPRRLPRPRPLQPVHVDRRRPRVPGRGRPGRRARRARTATARSPPGRRTPPRTARRCSSAATRARSTPSSRCCATCSSGALDYARKDGERFFDAAQNARVVADAERYYRAMYYGSAQSWNLRDTHMFETLQVAPRVPRARLEGRSSGSTTRTSATPRPRR